MNNIFHFEFSYWQPFLLAFIPLLINLGVFTYVFLRLPRSGTNSIFIVFIIQLCIWQAIDSVVRLCQTEEQVSIWYNMLSPFINLVTPLSLHFALAFSENRKLLKKPLVHFLIYAPALFFIIANIGGFITYTIHSSEFWRWTVVFNDEPLPSVNAYWVSLLALITLIIFIQNTIRLKLNNSNGRQALLVAVGFGIPTIQGVTTEVIFPNILNMELIPLTSTFMSVFSACVIVAFKKYKLFSYSPQFAWSGIINNMREGVLISDYDGRVKFVNKSFCEMTGYNAYELLGKIGYEKYIDNAHYRQHVLEAIERRKKMISDRYQLKLRKKNGESIFCEVSDSPYLDKNGNNIGSLVIFTDLTYRKNTENRLMHYTHQLENKNQILEQFVYIASHDLQEPLRTVSGFVELFERKYSDTLDDNAKIYLSYIHGATDRMQFLIKDLLDYSRIGRKTDTELIECELLVKEVIEDIGKLTAETKAKIKIEALPEIHGFRTEIKLLFQNLIVNAIKFRKKETIPEISISYIDQPEHIIFNITDNGIGIEPEFKTKIFEVFQRLHSRTEFEGNGIGLAHCKKIVELHGGLIGVDSTPGKGSRFYFTLPKKIKDEQN